MKLVPNANRVFSTVLRDGATQKAIYGTQAALFVPEFLRTELARHREDLQRRSKMNAKVFGRLV